MKESTNPEYLKASKACDKANEKLIQKMKEQEAIRAAAESTLARLDNEIKKYYTKLNEAEINLMDIRRRMLGPWEVSKYFDSGTVLTYWGTDKCWDRRVWLRMVYREERNPKWQWEVEIHSPEGFGAGVQCIVLGPMEGPREADFKRHQAKVNEMLTEMGYILP